MGGQLEGRGWTEQEVQAVVNEGPVGTTMDSRSAGKPQTGCREMTLHPCMARTVTLW
ncbi:colicin E5-related ribonuclease [Paraburkholderia strydomiana]|uniref:colicin E5-related ribonuclease n=1 Tax=Paraburkholderia strydomiana TaxID=1245417 RepID=UPI0038BD6EBB